ncbi:9607_t:CDS:2, partial [Cetraspora pellucida]
MTKKFEKYWKSILEYVIIAHILDPRYKLDHLKATLIEVSSYNNHDAKMVVNYIRKKLITYGAKYSSINTIEFELELYESELSEDSDDSNEIEKNNGIKLWESLSSRFSILSKMAHDFLSIKPLSVSSERAFSKAGFTITSDRANICEKT